MQILWMSLQLQKYEGRENMVEKGKVETSNLPTYFRTINLSNVFREIGWLLSFIYIFGRVARQYC
jgi:hypothetical protein